ncbi:Rha family transcriptional regulator [Bacillus cereus]|nr:Rha family transcriptional regulator [Bacillus cereus]
MNQLQVMQHPTSELVFVKGSEVVTDSLTVAQIFNKEHKHVLRDIRNQRDKLFEAGEHEFVQSNFGRDEYKDAKGEKRTKLLLTEDSFMMIAMSYTTIEAMKMKVKFIEEFKRMKEYIQNQQKPMSPLKMINVMTNEMMKQEHRLEKLEQTVNERMTVDYSQQLSIKNAVGRRVYKLWEDGTINQEVHDNKKKLFSAIWKDVKAVFAVNSYCNIRQKDFDEAVAYINAWRPRLV